MKATKRIGWAAVAGWMLVLPAGGQEASENDSLPSLKGAEVTIPYGELKSLWEAARRGQEPPKERPAPEPPVTALVKTAEYELQFGPDQVTLEARYLVTSLTRDWQTIPLLGGEACLEEAATGAAGLLWENSSYCLLTEGIGDHEAHLKFAVSQQSEWLDGLRLRPGQATMSRLLVTGIPEGKDIRIPGLKPTRAGDGSATFHLPGASPELVISLERYEKPAPPAEPAPPTPSTWDIQSEVFVSYQEGRIHYENAIYCQADDGSGLSMDLLLPHNALDLSVDGKDLDESQLGPRQDGSRTLRIDWHTRDILDRNLAVGYDVPQSPLAPDWHLSAPRVAGEGKTNSLFAILAVDGLELRGDTLRESVQSRRLPEWLRARIGQREFLTAEAEDALVLHTTWLPRVETAQAMVSAASYDSRLVQDGSLLVHAEFTIQHQAPITWRVSLPAIEEILSCEINQVGVQPVRRGESEIEFSLAQPAKGASKVGFCFAAKLEAFDPVSGRLELTMPKTDLFIHELKWTLSIPIEYQAEIQGNVVIDQQGDPSSRPANIIPLKKELVRGEHPAVEIHYQRRGLSH